MRKRTRIVIRTMNGSQKSKTPFYGFITKPRTPNYYKKAVSNAANIRNGKSDIYTDNSTTIVHQNP